MMMKPFLLSNLSSPPPLINSHRLQCKSPPPLSADHVGALTRILRNGVSIVLSVGILLSSPTPCLSIAIDSSPSVRSSPPVYLTEKDANCREDEAQGERTVDNSDTPQMVTNEGLVEEAWEIVYESFLDTSQRHRWSPESWLQKKENVLGTSIKSRSKAHDIIRRMLASLGDHYTRFLTPAEFSKMARYDMTGIGINLREIPDDTGGVKLKVLGILLDGPAHSAGVRQGDELLTVNGKDVKGKSAFEASSLLQGPSETFVNITVKHGNCGPVEAIEVQRQSVAKTPVFYRLEQIENGDSVGYVRLKEFNALARKDLVTAIKRLEDMGATYFVLDLRENLGGLVQAGIEIAKLFLNKGETVTYTVGRDPQYVRNIVAEVPPLVTAPVIVLVNKNTASASEIVATAVHDNCRAVLVGERTYGKGLIQSVFELHDGSGVVVTVGKYVTPNHVDINGNGVEPDFQSIPAWSEVMKHLSKCHKPQEGPELSIAQN
ncbi:OLC1v1022105C4 [Oldenlandia corymbosa var. corymbosa]|uniref:C-terminal processing peptidase n=1 Tax=Oldenlandia corymbosa var. corymbosa TaxID=529605 RepID=A0AAV1BZR4_OLDCO|nr:OLC1v1022105C4 [Oldenlandia corymbosa var. corymbosa]